LKVIPDELKGVLESTPDTLHGAIRFAGTRIFAYQLFDYMLTGRSLEDFLRDFEGVQPRQAEALLKWELSQIRNQFETAS